MAAKIIVFMCVVVISYGIDIGSLKLDQVVILSRHNVRTPLTANLERYSAKPWPKWNHSAGLLTEKGALLEGYMGQYIAEWLDSEDLIEGCPREDEVFIYANTKTRTLDTAQAFVDSAFQFCNVTVKHNKDINVNDFDPIFLPTFHNKTQAYKKQMLEEMTNKLNGINLTQSFIDLGKILNLENADICKKLFLCDLNAPKSEVVLEDGEEPNIDGPLYIGNVIVDSFIMSFYEGMPLDDVAWGQIKTDAQWRLLTKISKENQNVRFNSSGSNDIAGPLLKFMFEIFEDRSLKFSMLVGHDSNLNPVMSALGFKSFKLPEQFEVFPIGGKLVFQRWVDKTNEYLKVEYVYPSIMQLRNALRLSLAMPPQRVLLELKKCKTDANGFCLWDKFMKLNKYS